MATTTTNLGLKKPALTDDALISDINDNMDDLDSVIGAVPSGTSLYEAIGTLNSNLKLYYLSKSYTLTVNAGTGSTVSFETLGLLPPTGYAIISANVIVTGSGSVNNAIANIQGLDGSVDAAKWALKLMNIGSTNATWTYRIICWYVKTNITEQLPSS